MEDYVKFALNTHVSTSHEEMVTQLRKYLLEKLAALTSYHGTISIGVSGGSMPKIFCEAILGLKTVDWSRTRIFMVDERNVDAEHEDSNYGAYLALLPQEYHEYVVPVPIFDTVEKTAIAYEQYLRKYLMPEQYHAIARFDMLLLGVGPDGHTASLFPKKERPMKVTDLNWVAAVNDSPKPPSARVTLTLSILNNAKNVAFIIKGKEKAHVVRGIVEHRNNTPAALVRPTNNRLDLFVDTDAHSEVSTSDSGNTPPLSPKKE